MLNKKLSLCWNNMILLLGLMVFCLTAILTSCSKNPGTYSAFTNVNLVPMTDERIIENQTVLVEGTKIIAIGDSGTLRIPQGTQVIDGNGAFLMPGLADMHMHTRADWENPEVWPIHPLYLYLANGVTTVRDFAPQGSPLTYALQWRDEIQAGTRVGPTIYTSGKLLYASPLGDPEGIVRKNYDLGFDFLKLYSYLTVEDFHDAMVTAKEIGMYSSGHIPFAVGLDGVLAEGMDEIAHVEELIFEFIDFDRDKQLQPEGWMAYLAQAAAVQFSDINVQTSFEQENIDALAHIVSQLKVADIPVCTTMVVDDLIQRKLFTPEDFLARPENIYFENGYLENFLSGMEKHQVQCHGVEEICALKYEIDRWILSGLHGRGVLLLLGTDSGTGGMGIIPGYSIHDELRILVENGFSPYEALLTGTVNAAIVVDRMTGEGDFGTVIVGNRADLILVKENPLEDLTTIKDPLGVMAAGRWYSDETITEFVDVSKPIP